MRKTASITVYRENTNIHSTSNFAPKKRTVYVIPKINECMAILPRDLGNYILSFTTVWVEYYLKNMLDNFGVILYCDAMNDLTKNMFTFTGTRKNTIGRCNILTECILDFISGKVNYGEEKFNINTIPVSFQKHISIRAETWKMDIINKKNNELKFHHHLRSIVIGDIYSFPKIEPFMIIGKAPNSYKIITIRINQDNYTITVLFTDQFKPKIIKSTSSYNYHHNVQEHQARKIYSVDLPIRIRINYVLHKNNYINGIIRVPPAPVLLTIDKTLLPIEKTKSILEQLTYHHYHGSNI